MRAMKFLVISVLSVFLMSSSSLLYAADDPGTVKEEVASDKAAIKSERTEIKEHAAAARSEEKALRGEIKEAREAGDIEKAKELKAELKSTHKENVAEMRHDKKDLHAAKKELRHDKKAAKKAHHKAM